VTALIKINFGNLKPSLPKPLHFQLKIERILIIMTINNSITFMHLSGGWVVLLILHEMTRTWFCFMVRVEEGRTLQGKQHTSRLDVAFIMIKQKCQKQNTSNKNYKMKVKRATEQYHKTIRALRST